MKTLLFSILFLCTIFSATAFATFILQAPYVSDSFTIDGYINEIAWQNSQKYTKTFGSGSSEVNADIYFAHDNTFLYIGLDTPVSSGHDSFSQIYFDGDHNHINTLSTPESSPHYDVHVLQISPNGYSGYWTYLLNNPNTQLSSPAGLETASSGNSEVSYEYKIPIWDLTDSISNTIGIDIMIQSDDNKDLQYYFPVSQKMRDSDPLWMDVLADTPAWADLNFVGGAAPAPVPEPATMFLLGSGLLGLAGFRKKFKKK